RGPVRGEPQRGLPPEWGLEQSRRDQLPEHAAPLAGVEIGADAVGAQPVVPELADPCGIGAAQHVGEVRRAEALAGAVDAGQGLAYRLGAVPGLGRRQAVVAVAAVARMRFAEPAKQGLPAARGGFAVADGGVGLASLRPLAFLPRFAVLDHPAELHRVAQAVRQPRLRGFAIATGAPGFLVVALERPGQVEV